MAALSLVLAQSRTTPTTLLVHIEGNKKLLTRISNSDLAVFDNNAKVDSVLEIVPAMGHDAVFAIVVDASGSNLDKIEFIKRAALEVFDAEMTSPGSKGLLFSFADTVEGGDTWVTRTDLQNALRAFRVKHGATSSLYAAIVQAANRLGKEKDVSRRLLFVIADGEDNSQGVTSEEAGKACLRSGVTIIPIGLLSYGREKVGKANLTYLADVTGGQAVILDGPAIVKARVSYILGSEYVVTFTPNAGQGFHSVRMELVSAPKGVSLKSPRGYFVP